MVVVVVAGEAVVVEVGVVVVAQVVRCDHHQAQTEDLPLNGESGGPEST